MIPSQAEHQEENVVHTKVKSLYVKAKNRKKKTTLSHQRKHSLKPLGFVAYSGAGVFTTLIQAYQMTDKLKYIQTDNKPRRNNLTQKVLYVN